MKIAKFAKTATSRRITIAAVSLLLAAGGTATAAASASGGEAGSDAVASDFSAVSRSTAWSLVGRLQLKFPTYHTEGIAFAGDRIFLSSVQIIEPTVKYPVPQGRYDRTPGKGIGHLFVIDRRTGALEKDVVLGEGDMYHPSGIDFDGTSVWVPVAEYRPNSAAIMYRVDATTLDVHEQFRVQEHIGGVVRDRATGHLIAQTWGSRRFLEFTPDGRQLAAWDNPGHFIDYQDCQSLPDHKMICGGITNLPQTPSAGGAAATYELGGIGLLDVRTHELVHEVPFQQWSAAGHVATRNPFKIAADGTKLTMWLAPDNGEETGGTEILTYQATVPAAQ